MAKWIRTTETIRFEVSDYIARITLNRPEKRNALNTQLLSEMRDALLEADDLRSVRCIVLAGEGKDFCAGYDIGSNSDYEKSLEADVSESPVEEVYRGSARYDDDAWQLERMSDLKMPIFDLHKPVIARVHGNCLAGGTDIALLADMIIAADDARIGFPATRAQGSPPNNMWLYHVGPQWAKRLTLTGDIIRGREAARIGLVLQSVPAAELDHAVDRLAGRLAAVDADILAANKRIINVGLEMQGARTLQRMAHEMDTRAHQSPARSAWRANVREFGLKEALRMRDAPFGSGEIDPAEVP
ncbi:crotonase/enoyl-CoA hydratase family protein [Sphingobium sp.]|uniref:crotonase/enoyl-CoA hydratase family protein n=1 Tax=Sphingobium sp. TaxID=1912891 RepID=UPI0028BD729E|nr:crotonase/enoyl-CoA hydratase family protein [Sphingobium sp.]